MGTTAGSSAPARAAVATSPTRTTGACGAPGREPAARPDGTTSLATAVPTAIRARSSTADTARPAAIAAGTGRLNRTLTARLTRMREPLRAILTASRTRTRTAEATLTRRPTGRATAARTSTTPGTASPPPTGTRILTLASSHMTARSRTTAGPRLVSRTATAGKIPTGMATTPARTAPSRAIRASPITDAATRSTTAMASRRRPGQCSIQPARATAQTSLPAGSKRKTGLWLRADPGAAPGADRAGTAERMSLMMPAWTGNTGGGGQAGG